MVRYERNDNINDRFPWPLPRLEKVACDHAASCPTVQHERAPRKGPRHCPCPAPEALHSQAGRTQPDALQHGADAHHNEKTAAAELRPPPEPPQTNVVQYSGDAKCAKDRARLPEERTAGV